MDILAVFSSRAWQHLIVALLHTLWQGAILALLMAIALRRIPCVVTTLATCWRWGCSSAYCWRGW